LLNAITDREAQILKLRYGLSDGTPKTLGEVGKYFGITRERVRQIEKEAIIKLNRKFVLSDERPSTKRWTSKDEKTRRRTKKTRKTRS
jgi:DNA-directed RNA polymerase sigma subunit (sigma70/sigma32)